MERKRKNFRSKRDYTPPEIKKLNNLELGRTQPPSGPGKKPPSIPGPSAHSPSVPAAVVF